MKKIIIIVASMLVIATTSIASVPPQTLIKSQSTTLMLDYEIGDAAITDPNICDFVVQDNRKEIYLNPKKEGKVTLTLWDKSGVKQDTVPINIIAVGSKEILEDARNTFENSGNLKFVSQGDQIIIRGDVASATELARIQAFANQFPQVKNETKLSKAVLETVSSEIEKAIATPGIHVRIIRDHLALEGVAYSSDAAARAQKIAQLYDESVLNFITVKDTKRNPGQEKIVQLDVHFMEIKKNALKTFGINWAPGSMPSGGGSNATVGGGGAGNADSVFSGISGIATNLIGFVFNLAPKIKYANQKGDGRVLENPSFLVKSGEAADFFSGTQVPYYSQQAVVFKDVGIKIQAEPIASAEDVDLKINVTVTSPTAGGINKGIDTNTISTTAYCKAGGSIALAGIFRNADGKTYNRIPEDTNTSSSLFTLFLSKDFQSNRSEFVIFVTPRLVDQDASRVNTTTLSMADWEKMNESIIKKRSRSEYKEYMREKNVSVAAAKALPPKEEPKSTIEPVLKSIEAPIETKKEEEKKEVKKIKKVKEEKPVKSEKEPNIIFELPESLKDK